LQAEYKALEGKLEAANKELSEIHEQHAAAQKSWEEERTALKNDKKTLEDTIIDMSTSEKHLESDRSSREQEVRSLEDRAKVCILVPLRYLPPDRVNPVR
jgi:nucleoprotein TPR